MEISDLITQDSIIMNLKSLNKNDILKEIAHFAYTKKLITNDNEVFEDLLSRENLASTGTGGEIAIPHSKCASIPNPKIIIAKSIKGIDFQAVDNKKVKLLFTILIPLNENDEHLDILSNLSEIILDKKIIKEIKKSTKECEIIDIIKNFESNKL